MNKKTRYIFWAVIRNAILLFLALELFFRFVIPASNPPRSYFSETDKLRIYSNEIKDGLWTEGKMAEIKWRWHINNKGWNYPVDYEKTGKELIAIIGDSFVASPRIDYDKKYPYLLKKKLGEKYEVYAFGQDGAPLSQYLHLIRYVNKYFNPDTLLFVITEDDLKPSLFEFSSDPEFLTINIDKNGTVKECAPKGYNLSATPFKLYRRFLNRSALFRYVYSNLRLDFLLKKFANKYSGNPNRQVDNTESRDKLIEAAADYLIGKIKQENTGKRIIFVIAPDKGIIYYPTAENKEFRLFNEMIKKMCVKYNIETIDLILPMQEEYKLTKKQITFDGDMHWNAYGNEFVASLLYEYLHNCSE